MENRPQQTESTESWESEVKKNKPQNWLGKQWGRFPYKKILILGSIAIILDLIIVKLLLNSSDKELQKLGYETIKLSIQLILLVLFGGIIIQEYNRAREEKDARNEFKRTVLKELSRAYSDVKGVRRIIRANCASSGQTEEKDCISPKVYNEQMVTINATQLELEVLIREMEVTKQVFDKTSILIDLIEKMEEYLGKVISEYEKKMKKDSEKKPLSLSELPLFRQLITKDKKDSNFHIFYNCYHDALVIIQEERLKVS